MLLRPGADRCGNSEREVVAKIHRRSFVAGAATLIAAPKSFAVSRPQRVVTLEWTAAEISLSLGISPIGCAEISGYRTWVNISADRLDGATDLGRRQQPSLEAIRRLQPDLILSSRYRHASIIKALGDIAPVHLLDDQASDGDMLASVYQSTTQAGAALSRSDGAAEVLARFDDDIEMLISRYSSALSMQKLLVAQPLPGVPRLRVFAPNAAICHLLRKIGFVDALDLSPQPFGFTTIDLEGLAAVDEDSALVILAESVPDELLNASLWPMLPVVVKGNVRLTNAPSWPFGSTASLKHLAGEIVSRFV